MWKILESRTKDILQNKPKVKLEEKEAKHKFAKHLNLKTKKKKQRRKIYNNTLKFLKTRPHSHFYNTIFTITHQKCILLPIKTQLLCPVILLSTSQSGAKYS